MLKLVCDRCGHEHDNAEVYGYEDKNPYANAAFGMNIYGKVRLPERWTEITGRHLCPRCSEAMRDFLQALPRQG